MDVRNDSGRVTHLNGHEEIVSCGHISKMSMTVYLVMTGTLLAGDA